MAEFKRCSSCGLEKKVIDFSPRRDSKDGLRGSCRACCNQHKQRYQKKHQQRIKEAKRKYYREHKASRNEHHRSRVLADPAYALVKRLRRRLAHALRGDTKSAPTLELLGCTTEEFKSHLEKQFVTGMTWENRELWHIDHIRPCASFDLMDPEQQRECFHYSNLQPLWAVDNLKKGATYEA